MARTIQQILRKRISKFGGINTEVKDLKTLPDGVSPDALNWQTTDEQDAIYLRRGSYPLGEWDNTEGKVTGIGTGKKFNGDEVLFYTESTKAYYYDEDAAARVEIGADIIPAAQGNEPLFINPYQNLAGSFIYLLSPFISTIKIPVANPDSPVDQENQDFRGYVNFHQSRAFLWKKNNIKNENDYTSLYLSWVDKQLTDDYTRVTKEDAGNGDGSTKNFPGTLAAITGIRTGFFVQIAAAVNAGTAISAISQAASAVVTAAGHSLSVGDAVLIAGVTGMTQINSLILYVKAVSGDDITLDVDSSAFTAYSANGTIYLAEVMKDDRDGGMASPEGGTGTINYATGAFDVTFNTAPTVSTDLFAEYSWEDATAEGALDFSIDLSGGARVAGTGDAFRQFSGSGNLNVVLPLSNIFFGLHEQNTWQTSIPSDDSADGRTNLPYRERMGTPSVRGGYAGAKGIYFVDYHDKNSKPEVRRLEIFTGGAAAVNTVVPRLLSEALDLVSFDFSQAVAFEWGRFVLFACARITNGVVETFNSRTFVYNTESKIWDLLDYPISCLAVYNGTLVAGDPLTKNIVTLFSGYDDNGADIQNWWTSGDDDLGWKGQKRVRRMKIEGLIQSVQRVLVSLAFDGGEFVPYFTIEGNAAYVNTGVSIPVGTQTVGASVGGGGVTIFANPFYVEFPLNSPRFEYVRVKFEANSKEGPEDVVGGFVQINSYEYVDIRVKTQKSNRQG